MDATEAQDKITEKLAKEGRGKKRLLTTDLETGYYQDKDIGVFQYQLFM